MRQYDVTPNLVHLLKDEVEEVRANAAGALMSALVTTEGEAACGLRIWVGGHPLYGPPVCWLPGESRSCLPSVHQNTPPSSC